MLYILVKRQYLTLSIIESLERVNALLSKTGSLSIIYTKSNYKKTCSPNISLNYSVEAKITQEFLDKNLLLDKNLDEYSSN